jgi:hypothetical protein
MSDPSYKSITTGELGMLLEGAAYSITKKVTPYAPKQSLT